MSDDQPVMTTTKPWWESKTIITNAIVLILSIATFLLDSSRAGLLPFDLDERWLLFVIGLIGAVNMWLRTVTNQPVTTGKE